MLPVEKAKGQLWLGDRFLCDVDYEISEALKHTRSLRVQRIRLIVPDEHCAVLLDAYDLILVLADGQRHHIPRPLQRPDSTHLECYIESAH